MEIIGMEPQKLYFNFHHSMLRDSLNERTDMSEATSMSVRMCRGYTQCGGRASSLTKD